MAADQWKAAFLAVCLRRPISLKWVEYRCSWTWKLVEHILISEPYQRLYWRHFRFSEKIEKWSLQTYKFLSVSFIVHILVRAACWPWHAAFASDFQPLTELLAKDDRCHGSAMGFLFWTWQFQFFVENAMTPIETVATFHQEHWHQWSQHWLGRSFPHTSVWATASCFKRFEPRRDCWMDKGIKYEQLAL